ncbi:MAG: hypothetical protein HZA81_01805 [Candidatus Taylorbacteria bacterium]|nr:hypothetical protein [Candidatus Taylorbacteria bacterium]
MPEKPKEKESYMRHVLHFYFAPELRSVGTIFYLVIFGYFTLYYVDNLLLAIKFLFHTLLGGTALTGISYLFTGMAFVISLVLPFFISFYSIFVLHRIWHTPQWAIYIKWLMTAVIIAGSLFLIILSDESARVAARQDVMRGFIEDSNLTGRI